MRSPRVPTGPARAPRAWAASCPADARRRPPNGFRIRRLKDKLGTRALASGEIDFERALAWPVGALDEGFSIAVTELLNTSRWLNAVGAAGIMSRAFLEASVSPGTAAFGAPIDAFPGVREQLAIMKVEEQAALASTMALTGLLDRRDGGQAAEIEDGRAPVPGQRQQVPHVDHGDRRRAPGDRGARG